jgi:hypothetical protein
MGPQEQAQLLRRQTGHEPGLPQRPRRIQPSPAQRLARRQQLDPVAGRGERVDPDVVSEVEGCRVHPQGSAQPPRRPVQALAEARDQLQSRLKVPADGLDPDASVVVEQPTAVQDGDRADVLGPAELVEPECHEVLPAQAVHAAWLGHDVHAPSLVPSPPTLR